MQQNIIKQIIITNKVCNSMGWNTLTANNTSCHLDCLILEEKKESKVCLIFFFVLPLFVVQEASYYQKSETLFWTDLATNAFQRYGHSSSLSQTSPLNLCKQRKIVLKHVSMISSLTECKQKPEKPCYLVRTSNLQRFMIQESSNKMGNHPLTHTLSPGATFMSSLVYSLNTLEMGRKKRLKKKSQKSFRQIRYH